MRKFRLHNTLLLIASLAFITFIFGGCDKITSTQEVTVTMNEIDFPPYVQSGSQADRKVSSSAPPYYCLVSTLMPESAENVYRYDAYRINIPSGLLNKKDIQEDKYEWITLTMGSRHAQTRTEADPWRSRGVVRVAKCKIPPVPGMLNTLKKQLKEFNKNSWAYQNRELIDEGKNTSSDGIAAGWECTSVFVLTTCYYAGGTLIGCTQDVLGCSSWTYHDNNANRLDPNPGGGGGDPCAPNAQGEVPALCMDPEEPCETNGKYPVLEQSEEILAHLWEQQKQDSVEQNGLFVPLGDGWNYWSLEDSIVRQKHAKNWFKVNPSTIPDGAIYVHTHPTRENAKKYGYSVENYHHASDFDKNAIKTLGVEKGFILDEGKILVYNETGVIDDVDRCGY